MAPWCHHGNKDAQTSAQPMQLDQMYALITDTETAGFHLALESASGIGGCGGVSRAHQHNFIRCTCGQQVDDSEVC